MTPQHDTKNPFDVKIEEATGDFLHGVEISTVQVNIGLVCNLQCVHCHVASSPFRKEMMAWENLERVIEVARRVQPERVDITGGAPEMHPDFRRFVEQLRKAGIAVMVRTNLTILLEEGMEDLPVFFRDHQVELVASLPCYQQANVDGQRGEGVFEGSIEAIRILNGIGYGRKPDLPLSLVYNPVGPHLPPDQTELEADYRRELGERFGIAFTRLIAIANMPIGRYLSVLKKAKKLDEYRELLRGSFNPRTIGRLMCRHQINIDWDGYIYDCDFNLALHLPVDHGTPTHIRDFDPDLHAKRRIVTGAHCFGCTAGSGSSCGGALV
jgi:radical SAM/Cys-rich protein